MKHFLMLLSMLLLTCPALAEEDYLSLCRTAHPNAVIAEDHVWGDTAAIRMTEGEHNILLVAEKNNGNWALTIDNPTALPDGDVSLLLDADNALFWNLDRGNDRLQYHATKQDGVWGPVDLALTYENGYLTISVSYQDSIFRRSMQYYDENDNIQGSPYAVPVPAAWAADSMFLAAFDHSIIDQILVMDWMDDIWYSPDLMARTAAEVFPEYTFVMGVGSAEGLRFLFRQPDGQLVFAGVAYDYSHVPQGEVATCISTPLPEGTLLGYENFTHALYCPGHFWVDVAPDRHGVWGLRFIYNDELFTTVGLSGHGIGREFVPSSFCEQSVYGDHPWTDVSTMDWSSIPATFEAAVSAADLSHWAKVNNPNPKDRLHLRTAPSKTAASLGKFYNNTPVRILKIQGDWAEVAICGHTELTGWMLRAYLAEGEAQAAVAPFYLNRSLYSAADIYDKPHGGKLGVLTHSQLSSSDFLLIGISGDSWSYIWDTGFDALYCVYLGELGLNPGNG